MPSHAPSILRGNLVGFLPAHILVLQHFRVDVHILTPLSIGEERENAMCVFILM